MAFFGYLFKALQIATQTFQFAAEVSRVLEQEAPSGQGGIKKEMVHAAADNAIHAAERISGEAAKPADRQLVHDTVDASTELIVGVRNLFDRDKNGTAPTEPQPEGQLNPQHDLEERRRP